jgi:outer membrane biosynthesis protein TonB
MAIEQTLERIAEALERLATSSEDKYALAVSRLHQSPGPEKGERGDTISETFKNEDPKPKAKPKAKTKPVVEEPEETEEPEEEAEETEEPKTKAVIQPKKKQKEIKFADCRTAFYAVLNAIKANPRSKEGEATATGRKLLADYCNGAKVITESTLPEANYEAFLATAEELIAKYD